MHEVFHVQAGERDCYLIDGHLRPALAGGDSLFSGGSSTTASASSSNQFTTPHQDILTSILAGGLPSVAKGYLDKVVIPTAMNNATVMGLGRSGAALEAVTNSAWQPGTDLLHILLGLPSLSTGQTTVQRQQQRRSPSPIDMVSSILGLAATGIDIFNQFPRSQAPSLAPSLGFFDELFQLGNPFGGAGGVSFT